MSDAGNILPQAEIDALFKQATGRSLTSPPEGAAAKSTATQEKPAAPKASAPAPAPASKPAPAPAPKPAQTPPPQTTAQTASPPEIDRILDVLESLTKRIDSMEKRISELSVPPPVQEVPDMSGSVNALTRKVTAESATIKKLNDQVMKITKELKGTPGYNARGTFVCNSCGSHGYLAVPMKCSSCGKEGYWGWYPEKKKK